MAEIKENDIKSMLKLSTSETKKLVIAGIKGKDNKEFPELLSKYKWSGTRDFSMALIIIAFYVYCIKSQNSDLRNLGRAVTVKNSMSDKLFTALIAGKGSDIKKCLDDDYFKKTMYDVLKKCEDLAEVEEDNDEVEEEKSIKREKIIENFIKQAGKITSWVVNKKEIETLVSKMKNKQYRQDLKDIKKVTEDDNIAKNKLTADNQDLKNKLAATYAKRRSDLAHEFGKIDWTQTTYTNAYVVIDQQVVDMVIKFCDYCVDFCKDITEETDERKIVNKFVKDKTLFNGILNSFKTRKNKDIKEHVENGKFQDALKKVLSFDFDSSKKKTIVDQFITRASYVGSLYMGGTFDSKSSEAKIEKINESYSLFEKQREKIKAEKSQRKANEQNDEQRQAVLVSLKSLFKESFLSGLHSIPGLLGYIRDKFKTSNGGALNKDDVLKEFKKILKQCFSDDEVEALYENVIDITAEKNDRHLYFSYFVDGSKKSIKIDDQEAFIRFTKLVDIRNKCPVSLEYYAINKVDKEHVINLLKHAAGSDGFKGFDRAVNSVVKSYFNKGNNKFSFNALWLQTVYLVFPLKNILEDVKVPLELMRYVSKLNIKTK